MKKRFSMVRIAVCITVGALVLTWPGFGAQQADPKARLKGFPEFVAKALAEWKVPGMAVAVVKDGKVILAEGYGFRDVANGLKVTPQTVFAIGSCSKAFTAATVGILVDEGKLEWDKPVREYLPGFRLQDDFAGERMTPRDLLSHRSGLPRHDYVWYDSPLTRQELFDRLRFLEPSRDFRTVFQYQNLMFMTAGHLVGELSRSTWEVFTRQRLFEPLGMTSSSFSVSDMKAAADHSLPYGEKKDQVEVLPFRNIDAVGPAGSINSNVLDMANWLILNLAKGKFAGRQVVSESALAQLQSPQMVVQDPAFTRLLGYPELFSPSYGMGWFITSYRGHPVLFHGGNIDGFSAMVSLMPGENAGLVILTNLNGTPLPYAVMFNVYDRLFGLDQVGWSRRYKEILDKAKAEGEKAKKEAKSDRRPDAKPTHPLTDYTGEYANPAYGTLSVVKSGDGLQAKRNNTEYSMSHYHFDVFELMDVREPDAAPIKGTFGMDAKGEIASVSIPLEPAVKDIVFARLPDRKMTERSFLEKFCGSYELQGMVLTVQMKGDNALILAISGQAPMDLIPYKGTEFTIKGMTGYSIEFKLEATGTVVEAVVRQPGGNYTAKRK